ncbi:sugar ABC transporter permease [Streptomyces sp. NBC_00237]|uniref:carbohydrate ABC transporter permease n=1 Tax=Streptomyces sp. NBC_00237 TaxID=2975687 RepID=UPI00224E24E0|nr:sugar ABC transporter permease [Streptomyces sp. NBC_00237]MCX5204772.1 sugar ABC transporter permease [Streptomyces sp. NBC_00237]
MTTTKAESGTGARCASGAARAAGPVGRAAPAPPPVRGRPRSRTGRAAALLLAPFFVLFVLVMVVPIGYAVWLSLFSEKQSGLGFGGVETVFSGLDNYTAALGDPAFREGFLVLLGYCALYIPLMIGGALALALLLDSALARARRFFQLALFLPHAVPGIIAALIWVYLYTPQLSPVVDAMEAGGIGFDFFSPSGALPSVVNIALWEWLGYNMVIFYAALQAVDRAVLEAATVDGAGAWRTAFSIKVPLIRASVVMVALFTVIGSLQLFTEPLILNKGTGSAVTSTWTPNMYAYTAAFDRNDYGLAAAASVLLALTAALLSFVVTKLSGGRKQKKGGTKRAVPKKAGMEEVASA